MGRLRQIQTFPVLDSVAWAVGRISKLAIQVKVKIRANMAKWEVMASKVLAIRIMETKDMSKIKNTVVMDNKGTAVMDNKGTAVMDKKGAAVMDHRGMAVMDKKGAAVMDHRGMVVMDKKGTAVMDHRGMVATDHKDMVVTQDNEDAEAIENRSQGDAQEIHPNIVHSKEGTTR